MAQPGSAADRTVHVYNVSPKVSDTNVREFLSCCGHVLTFSKHWNTQRRQFGFTAEFRKAGEARTAVSLNGTVLADQAVAVELASGQPVQPIGVLGLPMCPGGPALLTGPAAPAGAAPAAAAAGPIGTSLHEPGGAAAALMRLMRQAGCPEELPGASTSQTAPRCARSRSRDSSDSESSAEELSSSSARARRRARRRKKKHKDRRRRRRSRSRSRS
eukprot:TRINITY_DN37845_c0_g1_i1.p1 TRINITY_DN37845_c0_g1~~TRINITY_DN37845_c0_g1_i1.p1  ORF type:complete len:244 (+),score=55.25 TRINITY_DN37845_c0_g1_i1:87-734(+)